MTISFIFFLTPHDVALITAKAADRDHADEKDTQSDAVVMHET